MDAILPPTHLASQTTPARAGPGPRPLRGIGLAAGACLLTSLLAIGWLDGPTCRWLPDDPIRQADWLRYGVMPFKKIGDGESGTPLGVAAVLAVVAILTMRRTGSWRELYRAGSATQRSAIVLGGGVVLAALACNLLKLLLPRVRPRGLIHHDLTGLPGLHSFWYAGQLPISPDYIGPGQGWWGAYPSAHTTAAFALATGVCCLWPGRLWIAVVAFSAAGLAGMSRLASLSHHPGDVLAGAACGMMVVNLFAAYEQRSYGRLVLEEKIYPTR